MSHSMNCLFQHHQHHLCFHYQQYLLRWIHLRRLLDNIHYLHHQHLRNLQLACIRQSFLLRQSQIDFRRHRQNRQ